ncbi:unknown [Cryptophlebia leucotreta granulovirus]|uniref:Uncharacterized protein n=1 Tax=Cryptophlebia leucotreta granulosis virus TaxID=35254 RepID=Q7T5J7_GVCL|nr:hypothetical protein [Cryptophlebia leucotreta granulovirus]AAQ21691.1 unknown [Cryptophlebia leucotreta granulovirus]
MNRLNINLSKLYDANVEPIALKLAHNNEKNTSISNNINIEDDVNIFMWWIVLSGIFILVILLLLGYFILWRYDDTGDFEEEYGEL